MWIYPCRATLLAPSNALCTKKKPSPEHAPHEWTAPTYEARQQFATMDTSPAVDSKVTKRIQEVLGTLLYYARAGDCTMIPAIGSIAT
jgi:hypothetical protein